MVSIPDSYSEGPRLKHQPETYLVFSYLPESLHVNAGMVIFIKLAMTALFHIPSYPLFTNNLYPSLYMLNLNS
jgi:hypothetical protein